MIGRRRGRPDRQSGRRSCWDVGCGVEGERRVVSSAALFVRQAMADKKPAQYIRYTPSNQGAAHASGATNRVRARAREREQGPY
eukprot:3486554-Pleurochrysis_carterae.AAC.2